MLMRESAVSGEAMSRSIHPSGPLEDAKQDLPLVGGGKRGNLVRSLHQPKHADPGVEKVCVDGSDGKPRPEQLAADLDRQVADQSCNNDGIILTYNSNPTKADEVVSEITSTVIDDVSVGEAFVGAEGVRHYIERFFVGYNTRSELLSIDNLDDFNAVVRLDFTGDFGREIGTLKIAIDASGLIARIDADLE